MKQCRGCGRPHPLEHYAWRPDGRGGRKRRSRCRECEAAYARRRREQRPDTVQAAKRRWEAANPDKFKAQQRRARTRKLGLDPIEIEAYIARHRGVCEICGGQSSRGSLAIDHDHKTGAFRGLLCDQCNQGLGKFRDDPKLLQRAIWYLRDAAQQDA